MKKKWFPKWALVIVLVCVLEFLIPNHLSAFKAPDEGLALTAGLGLDLGLETVFIRNLDQPLVGDSVETAMGMVENLFNSALSGGRNSLSASGSGLAGNLGGSLSKGELIMVDRKSVV